MLETAPNTVWNMSTKFARTIQQDKLLEGTMTILKDDKNITLIVILQFYPCITSKAWNWNHCETCLFATFETNDNARVVVLQLHYPEVRLESFALKLRIGWQWWWRCCATHFILLVCVKTIAFDSWVNYVLLRHFNFPSTFFPIQK